LKKPKDSAVSLAIRVLASTFLNETRNQRSCFFRRSGAPGGKVAHFCGDNRKSFAVLPGAGGFNSGVKGWNIDLKAIWFI
jgi:hypothetical protein